MESISYSDLGKAAEEGNLCAVRQLIEAGADIDEVVSDEMTSLHVATLKGHMAIVQYLVQVGSDVNKTGCYNATPLMTACSHGFIEIARFLIQSGANVNAVSYNLESPLMYLCKGKYRVKESRTFIYDISESLKTCASEYFCGCLDIAKLLVASGADINHVDDEYMSPLVGFIKYQHYTVAQFLIQSGADINPSVKWGPTALKEACQSKHPLKVLKMLISAGADVDDAEYGDTTPLILAVRNEGYGKVKALLHAGVLVNATDSKGHTALKHAVREKYPSMIEILIKTGASLGKVLLLAVFYGHGESIQTLVTNGALPGTYGMKSSIKIDQEYLCWNNKLYIPDGFFENKFLRHLKVLRVKSLTPFMVALMDMDTTIARYFVRNLFLHPLDILLLQDLQKKRSMLEDIGLNSCFSPLVSQPWSLFNLSFLCVSFAVGFCPDRKKHIFLTGLPASLQRMLLYRDKAAFLPVKDWANLDFIL